MTAYRRTKTIATAIALAIAVAVHFAPTAAAQTSGGGELGPDYVRASASDLGAGTFPGSGLPSASPDTEPPYVWTRFETGTVCVVFSGPIPPELAGEIAALPGLPPLPYSPIRVTPLEGAPPDTVGVKDRAVVPPGAEIVGDYVLDIAASRTADDAFVVPRCAGAGEPLPAAVPSAADIWQQTPLPRARVYANPPGTRSWPGIANMDTHFWSAALPDAHADVTLNGYEVHVVARPVAYAWAFGDGTTRVDNGPGAPTDPTVARYHRRGDYNVVLYVVWVGFAQVLAPAWGFDLGNTFLGTVTLPAPATYHEAEIRALLRIRPVGG